MESKYWECQCDMWCKTGQYLDYKNWVCKNKLVGRVIAECTSVINETMINNNKNIFLVLLFIVITWFCIFAYFKWFKGRKLFKKYTNY